MIELGDGSLMGVTLRDALPEDGMAIRFMVWRACLFPFALSWQRFVVAEDAGRIVAVGQTRVHRDGSRELASVVVTRHYRGRGLGRRLVERLLERESSEVYVCCRGDLERYYRRFGFEDIALADVPSDVGRLFRLESLCTGAWRLIGRSGSRLIVMRRPKAPRAGP